MLQDVRLAVRALRATPIASIVAILSLALGIGANTALFSLVDSLVLRSLPVVEPQRLALLTDAGAIRGGFTGGYTYGIWEEVRRRSQPFAGVCAWWSERFTLAQAGGERQPEDGIYASGDYFTTLGVPALLGRTFTAADDVPGGGPVAIISYALWQRRFGGAGTIVGTPLVVEHVPFTIIGVTPPSFSGVEVGRPADVMLPLNSERLVRGSDSLLAPQRRAYGLTILLRLRPGQSLEAATATLRDLQPQIREAAWPGIGGRQQFLADLFSVLPAGSGMSRVRTRYEQPLVAVFIIVALVLLVACGHIAHLQLARALARRHDVSVRLALGAARWRVVRQSLVESLLLSGMGAALGLLFAFWLARMLVAQLSTPTNRVYLDLPLDWRLLVFTMAIAVATTLLFGMAPAFRATRVAPMEALKDHGRGSGDTGRNSLSSALVVAQVALSLVIIVAAGLFVRTFANLATLPLGFEGDRVLLVNVSVARARLAATDRLQFFERLTNAVRLPGVAVSAASRTTPAVGSGLVEMLRLSDTPASSEVMKDGKLNANASYGNYVTPGFFATYATPIKIGRDFNDRDSAAATPVIIVNEIFVRKFLTGQNPLGVTMTFDRVNAPVRKTIVGVVGDATYNGLRGGAVPVVYSPLAQLDWGGPLPAITLSIRASVGSPLNLARHVASALTAVDPELEFTFRPLADQVSAMLTQERLIAALSGFFGALVLLLAGLGLYGVTAYTVTRRRAEIGIRLALGAAPGAVLRLVLSRVTRLVAAGVLLGAGVSLWVSQFAAALLYGIEPRDRVTLFGAAVPRCRGAAVTLAIVGVVAGWFPASHAARLDPAGFLRES